MFDRPNLTQTVRISQLGEFMSRHFVDVFGVLLNLPATLSEKTQLPIFPQRISGLVGFAGETVAGTIGVHFSESFARCATAAMLGLKPDDLISPVEVNDVVGEVANMLTGGVKSFLNEAGVACAMSVPAIIRGTSFTIEAMPGVEREVLIFECAGESVVLEIHLKLI